MNKMISGSIQAGLVSSHFFLRLRHVIHPVLLRPLGGFAIEVGGVFGCLRGRPRGLRGIRPLDDLEGSASPPSSASPGGVSVFASIRSSSSISSTFGTTSSSGGDDVL